MIQKHLVKCFKRLSSKDGSNPESIKSLWLGIAMISHTPDDWKGALLQPILDFIIHQFVTYPEEPVLSNLLQSLLDITTIHRQCLHRKNLESLFQLWRVINDKEPSLKNCTILSLESLLAEVLLNYEDYGITSASLINCIQDKISNSDNFLSCNTSENEGNSDSVKYSHNARKYKLLIALISYDASNSYKFIENFTIDVNDQDDDWDHLIAATIEQECIQTTLGSIPQSIVESAINRFQQKLKNDDIETFGSIMPPIQLITRNGKVSLKAFAKILKRAPIFLQRVRKSRKDGALLHKEMEFLNFMMIASTSDPLVEAKRNILTLVATHVSSSLLKILNCDHNQNNDLETFLSLTIELIKGCDGGIMQSLGSSALKKMIIACLKFGIQSESEATTKCLVIVRMLLEFGIKKSNCDESFAAELPKPHQVFSMAISHSNFSSVGVSRNCPARYELISLLLCCAAIDSHNIPIIDWECFSSLLVGFNASLSYEDRLFSRLLYTYENSTGKDVSVM